MKALLICFYLFLFLFIFLPQSFAEGSVTINEFLANPNSGNKEWVEFYNPDNVDLSEYFVDDDNSFDENPEYGSSKKKLSAALIDISNSNFPFITLSSSMFNNICDSTCDYVVLFSPDGSLIDQFQYTSEQIQEKGSSIGRYPDRSNNWIVFANSTKGLTNNSSSPMPSDTPVPTKTPTPTKIPTPTKTPTSAKSPTKTASTPTKTVSSPTPTQKTLSSSPSQEQALSKATSTKINVPTSVLGQSTKSAVSTPSSGTTDSNKEVKTLGSNQNNIFKIFIGAGGIFIIACAILLFRYYKNKKIDNE